MIDLLLAIHSVGLKEIRFRPLSYSTRSKINAFLKQLKKALQPLSHTDPLIFADSLLNALPSDKPLLYADNILDKILALYDVLPQDDQRGRNGWMLNELWQGVNTKINEMMLARLASLKEALVGSQTQMAEDHSSYLHFNALLDTLFPSEERSLPSQVSQYLSKEVSDDTYLPLKEFCRLRAKEKIAIRQNNGVGAELILGLCIVCTNYRHYLKEKNEKNRVADISSDSSITSCDQEKIEILDHLVDVLLKPQVRSFDNLVEFKNSFLLHKTVLETNTDTMGTRFLNFIKTILSFGFWQSEQDVFLRKSHCLTNRGTCGSL